MSSFIELRERSSLIARQFRQCRDVEAGLAMVPVIETTVGLAHDFSPSEQLELATLVKALMACQERQDWLGLADYLLWEWSDFLTRLSVSHGDL